MALAYRYNIFTGTLDLVGTSGAGGGSNTAIQSLTPTQSGSNITLDLTGLSHPYISIQGVYKNGQLLTAGDPTFGWSKTSDTITVLNAFDTDQFQILFVYA